MKFLLWNKNEVCHKRWIGEFHGTWHGSRWNNLNRIKLESHKSFSTKHFQLMKCNFQKVSFSTKPGRFEKLEKLNHASQFCLVNAWPTLKYNSSLGFGRSWLEKDKRERQTEHFLKFEDQESWNSGVLLQKRNLYSYIAVCFLIKSFYLVIEERKNSTCIWNGSIYHLLVKVFFRFKCINLFLIFSFDERIDLKQQFSTILRSDF